MTVRPELLRELPPSTDGSSASHHGALKDVYVLLILVAASIVGVRILTAPGAFSPNDQSRWSTIRALVENGSYSIGHRVENADARYRDFGIIAQPGVGIRSTS